MRNRFSRKGFGRWAVALFFSSAMMLASVSASPPAAQEPRDLEGRRIAAVRIVTDSGRVLEENPPESGLSAGADYDALKIREALRQLYATGRFAEIRVEAAPSGDGARVDFVVRENLFFNRVRVEGLPTERLTSRALSALQLSLGHVFTETKVEEALERLAQTLREEGYYEATAAHELMPLAETRQMDVLIRVEPRRPSRIGAITLVNRTQFPDKDVLGKSRLRTGQRVIPRRFERSGERIRNFLTGKGHLGARVVIRRGDYDAKARTLPVEMEVVAGPRVRVEVTGAGVSEKTLRQLVPIYPEGSVDEDLLQEGRRNLRNYFERQGYFDTTVTFAESNDAEKAQRVITYNVERGSRRRLAGLEFQGNNYFSDTILRGQLHLLPATFLDRGLFSRRMLADDEASLLSLYAANGFQAAVVKSEIAQHYGGKEENIFVRFLISEGTQTRVADLRLEGAASLDGEMLFGVAGAGEGQPYSEFSVASDRDNILAVYFNEGFPDARFEARVESAPEPNRVNLIYRITEGPRTRIKQVLLAGYEFTKPHVIERELLTDAQGPLRQGAVVESQRRLYNLGVFSRVQIAPQNPDGAERDKTLIVLVDEARRYTLAYGGGIEVQRLGSGGDPVSGAFRASPRGLLEISKTNFAGRAHTISFKARASTLQGRALATYAAQNFLGRRKVNLLFTALADKTRDVRTFTSQRYETGIQVEQQASRDTSFLYRYSFRRVLVDPTSLRIDPQQIPLFSQPTRISGFGMTWIRERRSDPAEAVSGNFNTIDVSISEKRFGSSATFFRVYAQNSTFHRATRKLVFARSVRFGVQEPFSGTQPVNIPLPERFFSGGGNTLRGLGLNQAGPRDAVTGFPVGGLALLVFNNEMRFPMRLPKLGDKTGGAIFYDAGNVYSRVRRINLRVKPQPASSNLNYLTHTIGFGFRYATPIGPVRLDLGYLLNPASFNVHDGMGGTRLTRLPRFQFFFNIGSIF